MTTPPAYFINLDEHAARRAHMENMLASAGFGEVVRHPAYDARGGRYPAEYAPGSWDEYWEIAPWLVGVFTSHRQLWQRIAESGVACATIFEDDVIADAGLAESCSALAQAADCFDLVKLDFSPGNVRLGHATVVGGRTVRPVAQTLGSAAAYLMSAEGARKALDRSRKFCIHIDDFLTIPIPGWRCFQLDPAEAIQGMFCLPSLELPYPEEIMGSKRASSAIKAQRRNRGPLPYRLLKEGRRARRRLWRLVHADRALRARGGTIGSVPVSGGLAHLVGQDVA